MTHVEIKKVRDEPSSDDGVRLLVDRLWPRGVSKADAELDGHPKDVAPSTDLRKWFAHDPAKFAAFTKRYIDEVKQNPEAAGIISNWRKHDKVTLLYGARDSVNNEAEVLRQYLLK